VINWRVFWLGQAWWIFETWHFGWNFAPQSDAEIVCDGIVALITALAFVVPAKPQCSSQSTGESK